MSSFQLPQNPSSPTPNPMTAGTRYASSPNQSLYSGLGDRLKQQLNGMRSSANQVLSLENQVNMIAQECTQYPDGTVQKQDCMRRLQEIVQQRDAAGKAIKDATLPERTVGKTENPYGSSGPAADTSYDTVEGIRGKGAAGGYGVTSPAATPAAAPAPAATPAAQPTSQPAAAPAPSQSSDTGCPHQKEIEELTVLLGTTDSPSVYRSIELRINKLIADCNNIEREKDRQEKLGKRNAFEAELKKKLARKPTPSTAPSAPGAMPYSERGPGDQPAVQSAPEMTRIAPGMTGTQFGPMLGKFSPAQSTSRGAMDPYELALYEGTITPEEYRRLTGDGMEQPGVSDYENALNVMTGHAQYKGGRLPGLVDMPTRSGWSNVPGSPNFRLPANQMEPMSRPRQTEVSPGPVPPGARTPGPSFGERETARLQAEGLMPNPQQALEALNMAEARLSLGQIGPAEAGELQRIRQLKQRLVEDMARRQRGIF